MSTKSLTEAFEVKPKIEINNENVKDYEVFGDKGLLESIRIKIVQNLIEENIPEDTLCGRTFTTLDGYFARRLYK